MIYQELFKCTGLDLLEAFFTVTQRLQFYTRGPRENTHTLSTPTQPVVHRLGRILAPSPTLPKLRVRLNPGKAAKKMLQLQVAGRRQSTSEETTPLTWLRRVAGRFAKRPRFISRLRFNR